MIHILPTGAALGADVTNLDLGEALTDGEVEQLRSAFHTHSVLRFRNQTLSQTDQVRFSSYFGEPIPHPTNYRDRDPDFPDITIISNVQEEGKAIGALGNAEIHFHIDLVFLHTPGSISFALENTPLLFTGDTLFPGGPGATHFDDGDFDTIIRSITDKLFVFPDDTIVLPGHGDDTTIGTERPHLEEWIERGW